MQTSESIYLPKGTAAILTKDEIDFVVACARRKMEIKIEVGMSLTNIGFLGTSEEKEVMAIGAEFAFARMIGLTQENMPNLISNEYFDFLINGKTIDVKATKHEFGRLFIPFEKSQKRHAEIFALIRQASQNVYIFDGAATAEKLIQADNFYMPPGFRSKIYNLSFNELGDLEL